MVIHDKSECESRLSTTGAEALCSRLFYGKQSPYVRVNHNLKDDDMVTVRIGLANWYSIPAQTTSNPTEAATAERAISLHATQLT